MDDTKSTETTGPLGLLERHDLVVARMRAGTLGLAEYRREFARFMGQKDAVYKEIDARICETLIERWGLKWPERAVVERGALTRATFLGLLYDYLLVRYDRTAHASFGEDLLDYSIDVFSALVQDTTAADLADYANLIRAVARKKKDHHQADRPCSAPTSGDVKKERDATRSLSPRTRRKHLLRRR